MNFGEHFIPAACMEAQLWRHVPRSKQLISTTGLNRKNIFFNIIHEFW